MLFHRLGGCSGQRVAIGVDDDRTAYPIDATSDPLLGGVTIGFGSATTPNTAGGSFSVSTQAQLNASDYLPVTATLAGYQPGGMPVLIDEPARQVNVGLFPEAPVVPRSGFIKGFEFQDAGGGLGAVYASGQHAKTMDLLRAQDGANLVMTTEHFGVQAFNVATTSVRMSVDPFQVYNRSVYQTLVGQAKARGFQFIMNLGVIGASVASQFALEASSTADWNARFQVPATNTAFWDAWFAAWRPLVLDRAAIARDLDVEYLSLGFTMGFATRLPSVRWQSVIQEIRALGYKGKIMYFGSYQSENTFPNEWTSAGAGFTNLFDVAGVRVGALIGKATPTEVLAEEQPRSRMRTGVTAMLNDLARTGLPVMLWVNTPSVHGAVIRSEYIEGGIGGNDAERARTRDFHQQADAYQAVAEVVNDSPMGVGRVMGIVSAQYVYFDQFHTAGSKYDKGSSIRGKPAEWVLAWWFKRW